MKIALDATYSIGSALTGVGVYSRELLDGLSTAHPEAGFLYCYRPHRFFRSFLDRVPANGQRRLLHEPIVPASADVFHGLNQRLPRARLRNAVVTFHDLFVMTGEYSSPEFRQRFTQQAREAASRARLIIAVSAFTAGQVEQSLGIDRGRLRVVSHGVRIPASVAPPASREPVVLHVGAIQKRKNVVRLVKAFEALPQQWTLVLAGSCGYGAAEVMDTIQSSPARERILMPGYVTSEELRAWYQRAAIFAFPSLDEGFGIPVLDAMAAGIPVLTSNRSALPEVAGDAALLVDPERTEAIADALRRLAENEELRADLAHRGRQRASEFSWEVAVSKTWAVYAELVAGA